MRGPVIPPDRQYRGGGKPGRRSRKAPLILRDMRLVYGNPGLADPTPGQAILLKLLRDDPGAFVAQLREAEAAHAAHLASLPAAVKRMAPGSQAGTAPPPPPPAPAPAAEQRPRCSDPAKLRAVRERLAYYAGKGDRDHVIIRRELVSFLIGEAERIGCGGQSDLAEARDGMRLYERSETGLVIVRKGAVAALADGIGRLTGGG